MLPRANIVSEIETVLSNSRFRKTVRKLESSNYLIIRTQRDHRDQC